MVNGTMQSSITPFLAIVFPPNSVSEDFMRKAWQSIKSKSAVKDFFVLNTDQPIRIEKLSDGCFLMMWQVLYKVNIYEQKLKWLETNLS